MSNLHELLKRAIVRENRDPRETFDAYFGECRKMFKFCKKPASQWTGKDVEEYIWQVLHAGNYSRSSRKNYLCAMAFVIFWLSIWTAPHGPSVGFSAWGYRAFVIAWGFYLCRKLLHEGRPQKGDQHD